MTWFDLSSGQRSRFPVLPDDGSMTVEQPQSLAVFPVLGGYPQIQVAALGARQLTLPLTLWGPEGEAFFNGFVLPAYGLANGRPRLIQVSWGPSSRQSFTGRAVGLPPTRMELGEGSIFAYELEVVLVEFRNTRPSLVNVKTGQLASPPLQSYTVRQGDTLQSIARRFGVRLEALAAANNNPPMSPPPGTKLTIPK